LRRRIVDIQARTFARFVARTKDERLQRIMAGRLRRPLLKRIIRAIPYRVRAEQSADSNDVIEIRVSGRPDGGTDVWQLHFEPGRCQASEGSTAEPRIAITFDPVSFLQFAAGLRSAPELFLQGKIKVEGDMMLGARLPSRFAFPRPG
jgi:putative sterol carrier protein